MTLPSSPLVVPFSRGWRSLSGPGETSLVPQSRMSGPMPWVIAIMVALTVIAAAAGLALHNVAGVAADQLSGGVTVQVVEANPDLRRQQADQVAKRLAETPGVLDAHVIPQDEIERLIEPWLGVRAGDEDAIPVPALVDARLRDGADPETLGALRRLVRDIAPSARVDAQSGWLRPVFATIDSLQLLALALVLLLGFATSAVVLLSVRNALGVNRDTIEIVHLLGATDVQIARVFQRSVGLDATGGGLIGLGIGLLIVLLLRARFAGLGAGLLEGGALGWADWSMLAFVPLAGILLAVITARITVLRALRRML